MNDFLRPLIFIACLFAIVTMVGVILLIKKELHDTGPEVIIIEVDRSPEYL